MKTEKNQICESGGFDVEKGWCYTWLCMLGRWNFAGYVYSDERRFCVAGKNYDL